LCLGGGVGPRDHARPEIAAHHFPDLSPTLESAPSDNLEQYRYVPPENGTYQIYFCASRRRCRRVINWRGNSTPIKIALLGHLVPGLAPKARPEGCRPSPTRFMGTSPEGSEKADHWPQTQGGEFSQRLNSYLAETGGGAAAASGANPDPAYGPGRPTGGVWVIGTDQESVFPGICDTGHRHHPHPSP